jgi:hypothetical protein
MIAKKATKIIGIGLTSIGLSVFSISYNQGSIGQNVYSNFGCAVNATPKQCTLANNQMTAGFAGMIFAFFTALFGAFLIALIGGGTPLI